MQVTPFAGVWIEIILWLHYTPFRASLPSRECGLKCGMRNSNMQGDIVTPFAGVWIEIIELRMSLENGSSITNIK